jgi:hypothetical protein
MAKSMIYTLSEENPHRMVVGRKPWAVGGELKSQADCDSGVMIQIELYAGKKAMAQRKYVKEYGATVATTLRLAEPWKGSGRQEVADSWFMGMDCVAAMKGELGLDIAGPVKGKPRFVPIAEMKALLKKGRRHRGDYIVAKTTHKGVVIYCVCWNDRHVKFFLFSDGATVPGLPASKRRQDKDGNTYKTLIQCPAILGECYYPDFGWVDRNNRIRMDCFGLDFSWASTSIEKHYMRGMKGMNVTDAYSAIRYFQPQRFAKFQDGLEELVDSLLGISAIMPMSPVREVSSTMIAMGGAAGHRRSPRSMKLHEPIELGEQLPARCRNAGAKGHGSANYRRKVQVMCAICGLYKVTFGCRVCKDKKCRPLAICPAGSRNLGVDLGLRDCWARHKIHGVPSSKDDKADWRGSWWSGYEAHRKLKAQKAQKRPRHSTG